MSVDKLQLFLCNPLTDETRTRIITKVTEMIAQPDMAIFRSVMASDYGVTLPIGLYDILRRLPVYSDCCFISVGEVFSALLQISESLSRIVGAAVHLSVDQYEGAVLWFMAELYTATTGDSMKDLGISQRQLREILAEAFPIDAIAPLTRSVYSSHQFAEQAPGADDIAELQCVIDSLPNPQARAAVFGRLLREIGRRPEEVILNGNQLSLELTELPLSAFWILRDIASRYLGHAGV